MEQQLLDLINSGNVNLETALIGFLLFVIGWGIYFYVRINQYSNEVEDSRKKSSTTKVQW